MLISAGHFSEGKKGEMKQLVSCQADHRCKCHWFWPVHGLIRSHRKKTPQKAVDFTYTSI